MRLQKAVAALPLSLDNHYLLCAYQKSCNSCGLGSCLLKPLPEEELTSVFLEAGPAALLDSLEERSWVALVTSFLPLLSKRSLIASLSTVGNCFFSPAWLSIPLPARPAVFLAESKTKLTNVQHDIQAWSISPETVFLEGQLLASWRFPDSRSFAGGAPLHAGCCYLVLLKSVAKLGFLEAKHTLASSQGTLSFLKKQVLLFPWHFWTYLEK